MTGRLRRVPRLLCQNGRVRRCMPVHLKPAVLHRRCECHSATVLSSARSFPGSCTNHATAAARAARTGLFFGRTILLLRAAEPASSWSSLPYRRHFARERLQIPWPRDIPKVRLPPAV